MTPKEKATELVDTYLDALSYINQLNEYFETAKVLSLMCVNEITEALEHNTWQNKDYIQFYKDVKREINKL
jgi:hypothetical protein